MAIQIRYYKRNYLDMVDSVKRAVGECIDDLAREHALTAGRDTVTLEDFTAVIPKVGKILDDGVKLSIGALEAAGLWENAGAPKGA